MVVNLIVLWNMIYIDAVLDQLRTEGHVILDEDVARLSPLGSRHSNMLGRYAFTIPEVSRAANFGRSTIPAPRTSTIPETTPYVGFPFRCYSAPYKAHHFPYAPGNP